MSNWKDRATKVEDSNKSSSWKDRATSLPEELSAIDSALQTAGDASLGAVQGATFGFGDEIGGGIGAAKDLVTGNTTLDKLKEAYVANRDSLRDTFKKSEERSPTASAAGNLAGGVLSGLVTGGGATEIGLLAKLAQAAKVGAAAGAATGLGNSNADDLSGMASDTTQGAVGGAILGPVVQGAFSGAGALVKGVKGIANSKLGNKISGAFKRGVDGEDLVSEAGLESAVNGAKDAAGKLGLTLRGVNKEAGADLGLAKKAADEAGTTLDLSDKINKLKEAIRNLKKSDNPRAQKDVAFFEKYLQKLEASEPAPKSKLLGPDGLPLPSGDDVASLDPTKVSFNKASDINKTLTDFGGVTDGVPPALLTDEARNASKLAAKAIKDDINAVPGIAGPNEKAAASYRALKEFGLDDADFQKNLGSGEMELTSSAEAKLKNLVRRMDRDTDAGNNASDKISSALDALKLADPVKSEAIAKTVQAASERLNLAQQAQGLGLLNKATYLKNGPINLANRAGLATGAIKKSLSQATSGDIAIAAKNLIASGSASAMKLGQQLGETLSKDQVGRNASIFALMQNPAYREMLKEHFEDNNESQK